MLNLYMDILKNHYVDFSGRTRRKDFWTFVLINCAISFTLSVLSMIFASISGTLSMIIGGIYMLFSLATLLPSLGISWRRVQDTGNPGWFFIIPIYNLVLFFTEGNKGSNEFGPDPKAE